MTSDSIVASLADALTATEDDDPEVAGLLRQAAAEQTDSTMEDAFLRLSQEAVRRVIMDLRQTALGAENPLALSEQLAHVVGLQSTLMSDDSTGEAKLQAGTDLLAWLLDQDEGTR